MLISNITSEKYGESRNQFGHETVSFCRKDWNLVQMVQPKINEHVKIEPVLKI